MDKSTKIFLTIIGIVAIGFGIWNWNSESDDFMHYFAIFIGLALIVTVISIPPKKKEE